MKHTEREKIPLAPASKFPEESYSQKEVSPGKRTLRENTEKVMLYGAS